jgi:hypothetical protein
VLAVPAARAHGLESKERASNPLRSARLGKSNHGMWG